MRARPVFPSTFQKGQTAMAANEFTVPEWVFPGAQVVTYLRKNGNVSDVRFDIVKAVGKTWVTLENLKYRVSLRNMESADQSAGRYSTVIYCAVERYSEQGQQLVNNARVERATGAVTRAFEAWQKDPRGETARSDFRVALDRLDTEIEKASE